DPKRRLAADQLLDQADRGHPVADHDQGLTLPLAHAAPPTRSSDAAQALNSGIPEEGSRASLVSRLAPTQWNGRNTVSRRMWVEILAGATIWPRRVATRTRSPSTTPSTSATIGCSSTNGPGAAASSSRTRRVWAPLWYCASTLP